MPATGRALIKGLKEVHFQLLFGSLVSCGLGVWGRGEGEGGPEKYSCLHLSLVIHHRFHFLVKLSVPITFALSQEPMQSWTCCYDRSMPLRH